MLPAKSRILVCPHCGGEKEVLQLMSGNTFGAVLWSDNRQIAPMLPRVSFVQQCPKCKRHYLLTKVTKEKTGADYSFDTGELTWSQMKEALNESTAWKMSDRERLNFLMSALWAFNDEFFRNDNSPIPVGADLVIQKRIIEQLLPLVDDKVFSAELNREGRHYNEAIRLIAETTISDPFLSKIADAISKHSQEQDSKPFILSE